MTARTILVILAAVGSLAPAAEAGRLWALEAHLGGAWNLPLPLAIRQDGHSDLSFTSRWKTRALEPPLYYLYRAASWEEGGGWALDLAHHKLYLQDPPPEIEAFSVSHGYNLLTLHRLVRRDGWRYGAGLGLVIAHPESEVRGRKLDERGGLFGAGYYVSGPTLSGVVGRVSSRDHGPYVAGEVRLTLSYAVVPVAGGSARVPNVALHATVGAGWGWAR